MKTVLLLLIANAACVLAAPCLSSVAECKSSKTTKTCSASSYQFFRAEYCAEYKVEYVDVGFCSKWGVTELPSNLPKILYEDIESKFYNALCSVLDRYKYWPTFINPCDCTDVEYDYIFVDLNVSSLFLLEKLIATGAKIAILSSALPSPAIANSLYFNYAFYKSQYMRTITLKTNKLKFQKTIGVPNLLGGFTTLYGVDFDVGVQEMYADLAKIDGIFAWEKVEAAYKKFQKCEKKETKSKKETKTEVNVGPCGEVTYSTYTRKTTCTKYISSWFEEIGYKSCDGIVRKQGLCQTPWIGDDLRPYNFLDYMFRRIENIKNVHLVSGYKLNRLVIDNGVVTGIEIDTLGKKVTFKAHKEVIMGCPTLSMLELLYASGCGPKDVLTSLGYPVHVPIDFLGRDLVVPNLFAGLCLKFPKGAVIDYMEDDYNAFGCLFGDDFSPTAALAAQKAYFSVAGCKYTNLKVQFYAFSCCMLQRAEMYFRNVFYYNDETVAYMLDMIKEYDVVVLNFEQLDMRSRAHFKYVNKVATLEYDIFKEEYDVQVMSECFTIAQKIAAAKSFTEIGGSLVSVPVPGCKHELYSKDYIRESLYHYSYAGAHVWGGALMGVDLKTSVVSTKFTFNGLSNLRILNRSIFKTTCSSFNYPLMTYIGQQAYEIIVSKSSVSKSSSSSATVIEGRDISGPCGPELPSPCGPDFPAPCGPDTPTPCGPCDLPTPSGPCDLPTPCGPDFPKPCGPCDTNIETSEYEARELASESSVVESASAVTGGLSQSNSKTSEYEARELASESSVVESASAVTGGLSQSNSKTSEYEARELASESSVVESASAVTGGLSQSNSMTSEYEARELASESSVVEQGSIVSGGSETVTGAVESACKSEEYGSCSGDLVKSSLETESMSGSVDETCSKTVTDGCGGFAAESNSYSKDVQAESYDVDHTTVSPCGSVSSVSAEGSKYSEKTESSSSSLSSGIC